VKVIIPKDNMGYDPFASWYWSWGCVTLFYTCKHIFMVCHDTFLTFNWNAGVKKPKIYHFPWTLRFYAFFFQQSFSKQLYFNAILHGFHFCVAFWIFLCACRFSDQSPLWKRREQWLLHSLKIFWLNVVMVSTTQKLLQSQVPSFESSGNLFYLRYVVFLFILCGTARHLPGHSNRSLLVCVDGLQK